MKPREVEMFRELFIAIMLEAAYECGWDDGHADGVGGYESVVREARNG